MYACHIVCFSAVLWICFALEGGLESGWEHIVHFVEVFVKYPV